MELRRYIKSHERLLILTCFTVKLTMTLPDEVHTVCKAAAPSCIQYARNPRQSIFDHHLSVLLMRADSWHIASSVNYKIFGFTGDMSAFAGKIARCPTYSPGQLADSMKVCSSVQERMWVTTSIVQHRVGEKAVGTWGRLVRWHRSTPVI